jgi:hypothetical protein
VLVGPPMVPHDERFPQIAKRSERTTIFYLQYTPGPNAIHSAAPIAQAIGSAGVRGPSSLEVEQLPVDTFAGSSADGAQRLVRRLKGVTFAVHSERDLEEALRRIDARMRTLR